MLTKLLPLVESAGAHMKEFFYQRKDISYKGTTDLVTQFDVALEKELTASLSEAFPDFKIIGEESSAHNSADFALGGLQPGKVIYIDPIDGTTNFVHGFPFTCISVGAFVDKEPYCAVVCAPILGETYSALRGKGAFLNGKPIKVSQTDSPIRSLISTGNPYDVELRRKISPLHEHILTRVQEVRRTGSAALDLSYVAKGTFDFYYEYDLKPWDMAAGILMVLEAGGKVSGINGEAHNLGHGLLAASNGIVHEAFLKEIRSIEPLFED